MPRRDSLNISTLENWLWEAACKIRGDIDAPKYKDYKNGACHYLFVGKKNKLKSSISEKMSVIRIYL